MTGVAMAGGIARYSVFIGLSRSTRVLAQHAFLLAPLQMPPVFHDRYCSIADGMSMGKTVVKVLGSQ